MKKTNLKKMQSCLQYTEHRLNQFVEQYHQLNNELIKQALLCPSELKPLDILDEKLKEFVQLQRRKFMENLNARLKRYKDHLIENDYYQTLVKYLTTEELVNNYYFKISC